MVNWYSRERQQEEVMMKVLSVSVLSPDIWIGYLGFRYIVLVTMLHVAPTVCTTSVIALDACIWGDRGKRIRGIWSPKNWHKGLIRANVFLRLLRKIPWFTISLYLPSKVTFDSGIPGEWAGGVVSVSMIESVCPHLKFLGSFWPRQENCTNKFILKDRNCLLKFRTDPSL